MKYLKLKKKSFLMKRNPPAPNAHFCKITIPGRNESKRRQKHSPSLSLFWQDSHHLCLIPPYFTLSWPWKWGRKRKMRDCFTLSNIFSISSLFLLPLSYMMFSTPEVGYGREVEADTIHSRMGIISGIYPVN